MKAAAIKQRFCDQLHEITKLIFDTVLMERKLMLVNLNEPNACITLS